MARTCIHGVPIPENGNTWLCEKCEQDYIDYKADLAWERAQAKRDEERYNKWDDENDEE